MSHPDGTPLRAEDALFVHAQGPLLCQQVGAVLMLEPTAVEIGAFRGAIRQRVAAVPALRRRLESAPGRWRRPRWVVDYDIDFSLRVREVTCGHAGNPRAFGGVIDDFFSRECDPFHSPWEIWLVRGAAGPDAREAPVALRAAHGASPAAHAWGALRALRGLGHLAAAGSSPDISVCGPFTGRDRRYVPSVLSARDVARTARRLDTKIADLLITVTAEALGRLLRSRGEDTAGRVVRIAVPRAAPESGRDRPSEAAPRNRTAAVTLDVPISPAGPAERLAAVRGQVAARVRRGDDAAAALVLRAMNVLPPPLQRRAAVQLYQHRWFNMLLSVFPGARHSYRLMGARVEEAYPVLALADGVGLAVGAMTWERSLSIGVLADAALVPDADKLAAEIPAAFELYRAAAAA